MKTITASIRLKLMLLTIPLLLFIPLFAMQFSKEVNWSLTDFFVATVLLVTTVFSLEFVLRKIKSKMWVIGICVTIILLLMVFWADLAVGII